MFFFASSAEILAIVVMMIDPVREKIAPVAADESSRFRHQPRGAGPTEMELSLGANSLSNHGRMATAVPCYPILGGTDRSR